MILCFLPFSIGSSVFGRAQWRQQSYPLPAALFARRVVVSPYWNETNDQFQKAPKELSLSPCGLKTKRDSPFFDSSGQFELRNDLLPHSLTFEVKWHHHQSPFWKSSNLFGLVSHTAITDAFQMRREPPSWNATKKNWLVLDEFFFTPAVPFVVSFSRASAVFSTVVFWVETLCVKGSWLNVRARAVTGGGLFLFFGFIFVVFFFSFDYLISWTAEFLILHSSIFWLWFILTVLSTKTGSRRREETWPQLRANDQFRFLEGKKKILVNEHKRAGDSIGKRQLPQISLFFLQCI